MQKSTKIIIYIIIVFVFMCAGIIIGSLLDNNTGNGVDQATLEESRRIIASQREAIERLGRGAVSSLRIITDQSERIKNSLERERKSQELIQGAIENYSGVIELSEDARSEIQSAISILEKVEKRK